MAVEEKWGEQLQRKGECLYCQLSLSNKQNDLFSYLVRSVILKIAKCIFWKTVPCSTWHVWLRAHNNNYMCESLHGEPSKLKGNWFTGKLAYVMILWNARTERKWWGRAPHHGKPLQQPQTSSEPRIICGCQERWKFGLAFSASPFQLLMHLILGLFGYNMMVRILGEFSLATAGEASTVRQILS